MWKYESDQNPKRRHHWDRPYGGFKDVNGTLVGKCPTNLSKDEAEALLNEGIPFPAAVDVGDHPARIYVVHDGMVYRATPTVPGVSYHGFPEMIERLPPDRTLRDRILEQAASLGCQEEVARWLRSKHTLATA